jgi:hypothetical protein
MPVVIFPAGALLTILVAGIAMYWIVLLVAIPIILIWMLMREPADPFIKARQEFGAIQGKFHRKHGRYPMPGECPESDKKIREVMILEKEYVRKHGSTWA